VPLYLSAQSEIRVAKRIKPIERREREWERRENKLQGTWGHVTTNAVKVNLENSKRRTHGEKSETAEAAAEEEAEAEVEKSANITDCSACVCACDSRQTDTL